MNTAPEVKRAVTDEEATRISRVEELSYELTIAQVMATNVVTLRPDMTMTEALDVFHLERISGAPVVENGQMIGIVSIEDMIRALRRGNSQAHVRTYMTTTVFTIHDYDPVVEALRIFSKTHVGRLPVVDVHDKLVGLLTKGDITSGTLRTLQSDYQAEEIRRYRIAHDRNQPSAREGEHPARAGQDQWRYAHDARLHRLHQSGQNREGLKI